MKFWKKKLARQRFKSANMARCAFLPFSCQLFNPQSIVGVSDKILIFISDFYFPNLFYFALLATPASSLKYWFHLFDKRAQKNLLYNSVNLLSICQNRFKVIEET